MTDVDLVEKKLAEIETYIGELRTLVDIDKVRLDIKEERFAAHTLQRAIQYTMDVCSHVISDDRLGEPQTNQELFAIMERHGWISLALSRELRNMAGFRNILVHAYDKFDVEILIDVLRNHLDDFAEFASAVRTKLEVRSRASGPADE